MSRLAELEAQARSLLASDRLTTPTRRVLQARLDAARVGPQALTPARFAVLQAAAARLVPLGELQPGVDLAGRMDAHLAEGAGDGWRYAEVPPDLAAMEAGLDALDAQAGADGFVALSPDGQEALLTAAQAGGEGWPPFTARWFESLLASLCHLAYAHPLVQLDIGYDGMADAHGFQRVDPARG